MSATPQARAAVRAAKNFKRWGSDAAFTYALKRGATPFMIHAALWVEMGREARSKGGVQ